MITSSANLMNVCCCTKNVTNSFKGFDKVVQAGSWTRSKVIGNCSRGWGAKLDLLMGPEMNPLNER
jgi:hypothetical protein